MTELLFYHLQRAPLERVLPGLLLRSLERGWRCAVEAGPERLRALDDQLWTFDDESFLPHGLESDGGPGQPVVLVDGPQNPNGAQIRFLIDGAGLPPEADAYTRVVVLFDGNDAEAVQRARDHWRAGSGRGWSVTYWQQDEQGRWQKRG